MKKFGTVLKCFLASIVNIVKICPNDPTAISTMIHTNMVMFENSADWDKNHDYSPETISVFYEHSSDPSTIVCISKNASLLNTLRSKFYLVQSGTPNFFILSEKSHFYKQFLNRYKCVVKV